MTWPIEQCEERLRVLRFDGSRRFDSAHADRQWATAKAILDRLPRQPGLVLADEVGMGKTFVALGVAWIAAQGDKGGNPAVVMIPSSLQDKWPRDAQIFAEFCVGDKGLADCFKTAPTALDFFRLWDDPPSRRAKVIFLHHGAFHITRIDQWTKLALIRRAMHGIHLGARRGAFPRFAARILRVQSSLNVPDMYSDLLRSEFRKWRGIINDQLGEDFERDDPVPERVERVLMRNQFDLRLLAPLQEALRALPARESAQSEERVQNVRDALRAALQALWQSVLVQAKFRSPLLVLDEAHHLRHSSTKLASLFADESHDNVNLLSGALDGRFERMLFLTATPFQLGHHELISVLSRFRAIAWKSLASMDREVYQATLDKLSDALDHAQVAATAFDRLWQKIPPDLAPQSPDEIALNAWWSEIESGTRSSPTLLEVRRAFEATRAAMRDAEQQLRTWVIRHRRSATLPGSDVPRRRRLTGAAVQPGQETICTGITVKEDQVLPFLLAARAQSVAARLSAQTRDRYSTFADGLASSYESFLETSRLDTPPQLDDVVGFSTHSNARLQSYVDRLREALPSEETYAQHPKIAPVVARAVKLWSEGEKLVVFCHFRRTGHALVRHISAAIASKLWADLGHRLGCSPTEAQGYADKFSKRFDAGDNPDPMARYLEEALAPMVDHDVPDLEPQDRVRLLDAVRRFVRSPVFVAKYFDPTAKSSMDLVQNALDTNDASDISLRRRLRAYFRFFGSRSTGERGEREAYLAALLAVQPGYLGEHALEGEDPALAKSLLPNVRLANGATKQETRQRLMLSFNTPFFPDILVASSVFAEGVDLHLNCRHVIHHDLSWNPSDIEQRTGRLDRLGSRAEAVGQSIEVYLPYVGETQDEKQYCVVMDRERWFQVLMGDDYQTDDVNVDRLCQRIPLPSAAAHSLAFALEVYPRDAAAR